MPAVLHALSESDTPWCGGAVILVKPQFESGREWVGKGGIVRDPMAHTLAVDLVRCAVESDGGTVCGVIDSPITGAEGNREFLLYARFR